MRGEESSRRDGTRSAGVAGGMDETVTVRRRMCVCVNGRFQRHVRLGGGSGKDGLGGMRWDL